MHPDLFDYAEANRKTRNGATLDRTRRKRAPKTEKELLVDRAISQLEEPLQQLYREILDGNLALKMEIEREMRKKKRIRSYTGLFLAIARALLGGKQREKELIQQRNLRLGINANTAREHWQYDHGNE